VSGGATCVRTRGADLVLLNGRVLTMNDSRTVAPALAVKDGRLLLVGSDGEADAATHEGTRVVDLRGHTVVPGLIDAHTHVELTAYARHLWADIRGLPLEDILTTVGELVAQRPAGSWIVLQGTFGQTLPDREQLDAVAPENPVALRWSMHKQQLNSAALQASGITRTTVAPPGIRIHRDSGGDPSGLVEEGWDLLSWQPPLEDSLLPALEETLRELFLRNGVTTVNEVVASSAGARAYQKLGAVGAIPRLGLALTAHPGHQALIDARDFAGLGIQTGFGNQRVRLQAIKIFVDGGRDGAFRSTLMSARSRDWGLLTRTPQALAQEVAAAADAGMQVWVHAIGDLAQECAVSAVEEIAVMHRNLDHRTRIEHFANEMYDPTRLQRLVDAGGLAVPNPGFVFAEPDDPGKRLPPHATKYALRTLKNMSGYVPGNSDTAGAQPFTCNPWFVMQCMLLQQNRNGVVVSPDETISMDDALAAFTRDASYSTFREHDVGTLEASKLADLAVIDRDPFTTDPATLHETNTIATVVGGQVVFGELSPDLLARRQGAVP
jgi:predicted amidohydrolase YtcJ